MENKNIVWTLKNTNARLTIGNKDKWLYFDESTKEWVVMEHRYRRKTSSEIIRTDSENLAVATLIEGEY